MTPDDNEDFEYDQIRDAIVAKAVIKFREARGNVSMINSAIISYIEEGDVHGMSPSELRDYFDVSSPGILEQAGYTEEEVEKAASLFDNVSGNRY